MADEGECDALEVSAEIAKVRRWRFEQARQLGVVHPDDDLVADSNIDLEQLRRLVRDGCEPHLAVKVLL